MSILIFIIILLVLVIVHEAGHFFTAKSFGIRVDEFGFGFPPKLFGKKIGETEYTFNALPLGGFVRIFGESPDEENMNGPDTKRSFVNKPKWQQALVLLAGIFANFLLACLLFSIGFMSGLPTSVGSEPTSAKLADVHLVVVSVLAKSPAEKAGLSIGDKIVTLQTLPTSTDKTVDSIPEADINTDTLKAFVLSHGSDTIEIGYLRGENSKINVVDIQPVISAQDGEPQIGISMDEIGTAKLGFFSSIWQGTKLAVSTAKDTISGLYTLIAQSIHGKGSLSSVTGPVGMVGIVGDAYNFGFIYLVSFVALISINLSVINIIPFPALDGGRLLFLFIEKIKGSAINPKVANTFNTVGFCVLILLMIVITYHDVVKLF